MLPRLDKGPHVISFTGAVCRAGTSPEMEPLFAPAVTYELVIR